MPEAVVIDTMVASAWLGKKQTQRYERWAPALTGSSWILPFTVVAELRFGAEVAAWGARRRGVLERMIARSGVVPPLDSVVDAYVDLRTWCVREGHGLGAKDHESDRWIAAVAIAGHIRLASDESIFDGVTLLKRLNPGPNA
jgi:predicted nucleic acid-binding protein